MKMHEYHQWWYGPQLHQLLHSEVPVIVLTDMQTNVTEKEQYTHNDVLMECCLNAHVDDHARATFKQLASVYIVHKTNACV